MPMTIRLTNMRRIWVVLAGLTLIAAGDSAFAAAPNAADLVRGQLLADVASVKPGEPFHVGVLLKLTPGWHVYWKNPGDSGLPTRVKWTLPPGWTVGELQFPIPKRIELPGPVINYGYEDEVMLTATIAPSADSRIGSNVQIVADGSWLVCEAVCIPGKAQMKLELRIAAEAKPANRQLFDQWQSKLPTPAEKLSGVGIEAKPLDLSSGDGSSDIVVSRQMSDVAIPDTAAGLELTVDRPQPDPMGTKYHVKAQTMPGQHVSAKAVEVLIGPYSVTIPILGTSGPATAPASK